MTMQASSAGGRQTRTYSGTMVCIIAAAMIPAACGGGDGGGAGAAVEDSAGVAIVRNDGVDVPLDWRVEQVLQLGGTDEGPEAFFQIGYNTIGGDGAGRIYALDTGNHKVEVFDSDGTHLRTMGGLGGGPGELMQPVAFLVEPEGGVQILDWGKGTIVRFEADGSVGDEIRASASMSLRGPELLGPGNVVGVVESPVGGAGSGAVSVGNRQTIMLVRRAGDSLEEPVELVEMVYQPPGYTLDAPESCPFRIHTPPIFSVVPVWQAANGRVLHSNTAEYVVDVTTVDGRTMSVRRNMPVVAATRDIAAADVGPMSRTRGDATCEMSAAARADLLGWADRVNWIRTFSIAPDGSLFVWRRAPGQQPPHRIDVFDPDGTYQGTLPADFDMPYAWRSNDEILRIERDDLGRPLIVVYHLLRSAGS